MDRKAPTNAIGGRKSEKLDRQIEQLELRLEDLQADEGAGALDTASSAQRMRPSRLDAERSPIIYRAKISSINLMMCAVRSAAERSTSLAKTSPGSSSTCRGIGE
ncbi:transposase [Cupriavidus taiwanensis]|uniref:transposase n=1 Tax=Cupriavidus taiwanensis TaxID=164546 RepID=UPI0035939930